MAMFIGGRRAVVAASVMVLAVPGALVAGEQPASATGSAPIVDANNPDQVRSAWRQVSAALATATGDTSNVSTCKAGTISTAHQQATLKVINLSRGLVGLGPVTYNTAMNAQEQSAALIMAANQTLNHAPSSSMKCWTQAGYDGASSSNLAMGGNGPSSVLMYLDDFGANNPEVGHRMWVLDPTMRSTAVGVVGDYSALYVFDNDYWNPAPEGPTYQAWPDAGYIPVQMMPTSGRWSLRANSPATDFSHATVTIAAPGGTPTKAAVTYVDSNARPYIVFTGPTVAAFTGSAVKTYTVTVSGIVTNGVTTQTRYQVKVIDGNYTPPPGTAHSSGMWPGHGTAIGQHHAGK